MKIHRVAKFHLVITGIVWMTFCLPQGNGMQAGSNICETPECKEVAKQIEDQMGSSTACEDFHNYVCGKWSGSMELQQVELKKKALLDLIVLLGCAEKPSSETFNATDKLINGYKSCTEKAEDEFALRNSTSAILTMHKFGEWPIEEVDVVKNPSSDSYKEILKETGPRPLFQYYVSTSSDSQPIIIMTAPSDFRVDGVDYPDYAAATGGPQIEERDDVVTQISSVDYTERYENAYREFIEKAVLLLAPARQEKKSEIAKQIIEFEKNLSKIYIEAEREPKKMTLKDLSGLMDGLEIDKVLQKDFEPLNIRINDTIQVSVEYEGYYKGVAQFLKAAHSTVPLKNYILWRKVMLMSEAEGTKLHDLYLEYENKTAILPPVEEQPKKDIGHRCLTQLLQTDVMYTAVANFYARNKFNEASKADVVKLMNFVKSSFSYFIGNNTWMSDEVKQKAEKRLGKMEMVIGYPDWLMNASLVNSFYEFVPKIPLDVSFVQHYYWLRENDHLQGLLKLNSSYFVKTHERVTLNSHAYYQERTDILAYPAASLVTHYRPPNIPRSLNFGTLGSIFGQLFTQAIDRFDDETKEGQKTKKDYWDNNTTAAFCARSSCLNNTEECIDMGCNSSKYERLHDYLGVRVSHMALKESKGSYKGPFLLPGDKFDSEDKIFLTTFGSLYCPYSVNEKVQSRADIPEEVFHNSLNEVVSQYNGFNSTFLCTGNVTDTCKLMPPERKIGSEAC